MRTVQESPRGDAAVPGNAVPAGDAAVPDAVHVSTPLSTPKNVGIC